MTLDITRPGKPQDNALIEAFNSRFRQACPNDYWFLSVADAQEKVEAWREHYNTERSHSALGYLAPEVFARQASALGSCLDPPKEPVAVG